MKPYLVLIANLMLLPINTSIAAETPTSIAKPNIIFILADDWGWGDLSCHGHPYIKTPNIDRLAKEGSDFHRFTVASGVCSPSRTALMTGHFPARYNIDGHFAFVENNTKRNMPDWLNTNAPTLPRFLKSAGYTTAHFGKWHLSNNMIPDSPSPPAYGYDTYGAFNCSGEQIPVHEDVQQTISFIEKSHKDGKPFFVNLWIHEPHTPFHVVPKYQWRFRELSEADNIYASVLSHADDRIGELLKALDQLQISNNTLVVFTSDNGPARGGEKSVLDLQYDSATGVGYGIGASKGITGGRKGYKSALFEGGIGVPFLARWPNKIPANKIDSTSLISAVDIVPTFCEIAGVSIPESYKPDGLSQIAALKGKPAPIREKTLFWKIDAAWPISKTKPFHWTAYAIVDQHWKLLANRDSSYVELYDLTKDALETTDIKEEQLEITKQLKLKLENWKITLPEKPTGAVFSKERSVPKK